MWHPIMCIEPQQMYSAGQREKSMSKAEYDTSIHRATTIMNPSKQLLQEQRMK